LACAHTSIPSSSEAGTLNSNEITEYGAGLGDRGRAPIAGSACAFQLPVARSVWPRTNDRGALDLSARSGVDRVSDAGARSTLLCLVEVLSAVLAGQ
jgi:hypothetical protein